MRFSTDEEEFGILLTPVGIRQMYRFQLIIQGELIGDSEPTFPHSGLGAFRELERTTDERLDPSVHGVDGVIAFLSEDEYFHDRTPVGTGESMDDWVVNGYGFGPDFIAIARRVAGGPSEVLSARIEFAEYQTVMDEVLDYFTTTNEKSRAELEAQP